MKEECENCKFWRNRGDSGIGYCQISHPVIVDCFKTEQGNSDDNIFLMTRWPITLDEDWCGEWKEST